MHQAMNNRAALPRRHGRWLPLAMLLCLAMMTASVPQAAGQVLSGPWVDRQDQRIDELRKVAVRVIVLDAQGQPVPGAQVHLAMQRHALALGVRLDSARLTDDAADPALGQSPDEAELWKLLNAISIEAPAHWPRMEPAPGQIDWTLADHMLSLARDHGLAVRWGQVISTDASRLPVWVTGLRGEPLAEAMETRIAHLAGHLQSRAAHWDVLTHLPDHDWPAAQLGPGVMRRLLSAAQRHGPAVTRSIRFNDALTGPRLVKMVRTLNALRDAQAPFSAISIDTRLSGGVAHAPLEEALAWLGKLNLPVHLTSLEVGGPTPDAAAINLETILRLTFAQPAIQGLWLQGLKPDEVLDPTSALLDDDGRFTPAGKLFVQLVGKQWWTDEIHQADALGNVQARVFAGSYQVHAAWRDGQARMQVHLAPGRPRQLVVVQALATPPAAITPLKGTP